MSVARFVQNFSQRRALIASPDARAVDALSATLQKLGLTVERLADCEAGEALLATIDPVRDILVVDGDLGAPASALFTPADGLSRVPVIGLVGVEAPSRLKSLMLAGATAFLQKPVYGGSVYSALFLAVNEHARRATLKAAVEELETRRRQRRHVIKAVVQVMADRRIDDDAAFQLLRREAMRARLSLETYCERLVLEGTAPGDAHTAAPDLRAAAD